MVLLDLNALPSWTPFAVAVVMLVALALLWLSMRRHLRRADRFAAEDGERAAAFVASPTEK